MELEETLLWTRVVQQAAKSYTQYLTQMGKKKASSNHTIPCSTLLAFAVGWAAGALAKDTTLAITGVESFLSDGGPADVAWTMEILAG